MPPTAMKTPVFLPLLAGLLMWSTGYVRGEELPGDGVCDLGAFEADAPSVMGAVYEKCDPTGVSCFPECLSFLSDWSAREPCLGRESQRELLDILVTFTPDDPGQILLRLESCDRVTDPLPDAEGDGSGDCDFMALANISQPYMEQLYQKCDFTGASCYPACRAALSEWAAREPCMRGVDFNTAKELLRKYSDPAEPNVLLLAMKSCDSAGEDGPDGTADGWCDMAAFGMNSQPFWDEIYGKCDWSGKTCYPACETLLAQWRSQEPCLIGDALEEIKSAIRTYTPDYAEQSIALLESCDGVSDQLPDAEGNGSGDCDFMALANISQPYMEQLYQKCDYTGESCYPECLSVFSEWFAQDPCMRREVMNVAKEVGRRHYPFLPEPNWVLLAMEACDRWDMESRDSSGEDSPDGTMDGGCDLEAFGVNGQPFWEEVYRTCDWSGKTCYPACETLLSQWRSQEPCLVGDSLGEVKSAIRTYSPDNAEQSITLLESCDGVSAPPPEDEDDGGEDCDFMALAKSSQPYMEQLYQKCDYTGAVCNPECESLLSRWSAQEPCLRGEALARTKSAFRAYTPGTAAESNIRLLESCDSVSPELPVINRGVCDYEAFGEKSPPYFVQLYAKCDTTGAPCSTDCQTLLSDWAVRETCLRGAAWRMTKSVFRTFSPKTAEFDIKLLESCDPKDVRDGEEVKDRDVPMANSSPRVQPFHIGVGLAALGVVVLRAIAV